MPKRRAPKRTRAVEAENDDEENAQPEREKPLPLRGGLGGKG